MADVDRGDALSVADGFLFVFPHRPGITQGFGADVPNSGFTALIDPILGDIAGAVTDDPRGAAPARDATDLGDAVVDPDAVSVASLWFERVHILPRLPIDFGSIVTQQDEPYEIYNAFRDDSITVDSVTNGATPGVELPDLSLPVDVGPQNSLLGAGTTSNAGDAFALGTNELLQVRALADGLLVFDAEILFDVDSPANDVALQVSGQRAVLVPFEYEAPAVELLEMLTDPLEALSGVSQRIAMRGTFRQVFQLTYELEGAERQRMQAILLSQRAAALTIPLWHEQVPLAADVSSGATALPVIGADDVDFRVDGIVAIIQDHKVFDVVQIDSVSDTSIGLASPLLNSYSEGTAVMPARQAIIDKTPGGARALVALERFSLRFLVTDNVTGAPTASAASWGTYNGKILFDDCDLVENGNRSVSYPQRTYLVDGKTGKVQLSTPFATSKRSTSKGFSARDRAQIMALRRLWLEVRGRQVSFYLPTKIEEVTPTDGILAAEATLDIEAIGYTRFCEGRRPADALHLSFSDGTELIRDVVNAEDNGDGTETLTVASPWGVTHALAEIVRIQFYDLMVFDTDVLRLTHTRVGAAKAIVPVVRVFDPV